MSEAQSALVLVVIAIAMVTGGVLGYGLEDINNEFGVEKVEEPAEEPELIYEPVVDPGKIGHPVVTLGVIVALSVCCGVALVFQGETRA